MWYFQRYCFFDWRIRALAIAGLLCPNGLFFLKDSILSVYSFFSGSFERSASTPVLPNAFSLVRIHVFWRALPQRAGGRARLCVTIFLPHFDCAQCPAKRISTAILHAGLSSIRHDINSLAFLNGTDMIFHTQELSFLSISAPSQSELRSNAMTLSI